MIQTRPAFDENVLAEIITENPRPHMATVRYGTMDPIVSEGEGTPEIIELPVPGNLWPKIRIISSTRLKTVDIATADVLVAIGRGVKRAEDTSDIFFHPQKR